MSCQPNAARMQAAACSTFLPPVTAWADVSGEDNTILIPPRCSLSRAGVAPGLAHLDAGAEVTTLAPCTRSPLDAAGIRL